MRKNFGWLLMLFLLTLGLSVGNSITVSAELGPANPDSTTEWEDELEENKTLKRSATTPSSANSAPVIVDISYWQGDINWAVASQNMDLVIIRTQYGSNRIDPKHVEYENEAIKYGVPFGVYAYNKSISTADARQEARDFYNRANKNALFYVIDVEEFTSTSGESMRQIVNAYVDELRKLTDKKIGLYIAHHLYEQLNLDVDKADFVWLPRYSNVNVPNYDYQLWQYTDQGTLDGFSTYIDLNRLAPGVPLSYFTDGAKSDKAYTASSKPKYYTSNPRKVVWLRDGNQYSSTAFNDRTHKGAMKKGTIVDVVGVELSANGTPRLKLKNGNYISANTDFVLKVTSKIDDFFTQSPGTVLTKKTVTAHSSPNYTSDTEVRTYSKNTKLTITGVEYTTNGTPRLKTLHGYYITANKDNVRQVISNINSYYVEAPSTIVTKTNVTAHRSTSFNTNTRIRTISKGSVISIKGIEYSANGTPRLVTTNGQYITANKKNVQRVVSNINQFFTESPGTILTKTSVSAHSSPNYSSNTLVKTYRPNTKLTITGVEYTTNGTPRLKTLNGYYVTANKDYVRKVISNINSYYTVAPNSITTQTSVTAYKAVSFTNANRVTTYSKNTTVQITGIEYSTNGTPRLITADGYYISANKNYVTSQ